MLKMALCFAKLKLKLIFISCLLTKVIKIVST